MRVEGPGAELCGKQLGEFTRVRGFPLVGGDTGVQFDRPLPDQALTEPARCLCERLDGGPARGDRVSVPPDAHRAVE